MLPGMDVDINELIRLEAELKTSCECETSPVSLDAKVNILKYLQVQTVLRFQGQYDGLYYDLNKTGGLECVRGITAARSTELLQPKVLDLQDFSEDEQLEKQLQFYLADAELAKPSLDELVTKVAHDSSKYEVQRAEVKSRESTRRKATREHDGDVRKVADMARVTLICANPEALKEAYSSIMEMPEGKYEEAEPLHERSQTIRESMLGPEHPDVVVSLNSRSSLLFRQEKYTEVIPLLERALSIRTKRLGENHPHTVGTRNNLEFGLRKVRPPLDNLVGKPRPQSIGEKA